MPALRVGLAPFGSRCLTRATRTPPAPLFAIILAVAVGVFGCAGIAQAQVPIDVVSVLPGNTYPLQFEAGLIQGTDGNFYGVSQWDGTHGVGTIFRMTPGGAITPLHSFTIATDGGASAAALVQASDGNFYGTAPQGGPFGGGTVFRITPSGVFTVVYAFDRSGPSWPRTSLIQAADGHLYGATSQERPGSYNGIVFSITLNGAMSTVLDFGSSSCGRVGNTLLQAADGNFYGTTLGGGQFGKGTAFKLTSSGVCTTLHSFAGEADGDAPEAALIQATDGNFYGTTQYGGGLPSGFYGGTVFSMTPDGSVTILHSFVSDVGGRTPEAPLIQASDGNFYGTTSGRGSQVAPHGTMFRMTPDGAITVLHVFDGAGGDWPTSLVQSRDGKIYGTTLEGGYDDGGTVFTATLAGVVTPAMHLFMHSPDPVFPRPLIQAADGNFYGTASGGTFNRGTIFRVTASGAVTLLYTFTGGADGASPSPLLQAIDGNFYGTTFLGGAAGGGTVFRMTPGGDLTILHAFTSGMDGANPKAPLIQAIDGDFYGTTSNGGISDHGTVFRMTADGTVTPLHVFTGGADGSSPSAALLQAADGFFYGATFGTVFRMTTGGALTTLHTFSFPEPSGVVSPLVQASDGNFYGTTSQCYGGVFRMTPAGTVTMLRVSSDFCGDHNLGAIAHNTLITASDGRVYGTFQAPISSSPGNVFTITPSGTVPVVHAFTIQEGGPVGLVQAADGNLYGMTIFLDGGTGSLFYRFTSRPAPKNLRIANAGGPVRLSWSVVDGATSYTIKRATAPGSETVLATRVTGTNFVDGSAVRGRRYYYVVTAVNEFGESVASQEVSITAGRATVADFDGDARSNITVFRPSTGMWYVRDPTTGTATGVLWGDANDIPTPGDYDGDGRIDIAVFRPSNGTWYIRPSQTGSMTTVMWGDANDIPTPGDYDGDGRIDIAVFRPSNGTWYIRPSQTGSMTTVMWGGGSDMPVPGDYDGDGKTDVAVYRPSTGTWYVRSASTGATASVVWGAANDVPVPGDYNGDGKTDVVIYRPSNGTWYTRNPTTGQATTVAWGGGSYVPVPGDYDGDGLIDLAVFWPATGTWYVRNTPSAVPWGNAGDIPIPSQP